MSSSSLSSVVSGLVRASMGSAANSVTDEDLDRHIGEIILREAKQKAERYKKDGIRAYLPATDPNVPRANKRFLSSIIKSTDDHNKAVLRSQAVAAAELKEERDEQERRERRARADEAAQDRFRRLLSGGRRGVTEDRWRPDRERGRDRKDKHRARELDLTQEDSGKERSRSRSRDRKRYWDEDEDEYRSRIESSRRRNRNHSEHRHHRDRRRHSSSRSRSPRRDATKLQRRPRSRSPIRPKTDGDKQRTQRRPRRRSFSRSRSHSSPRDTPSLKRSRSPTFVKTSEDGSSHSKPRLSPSRPCSPRLQTNGDSSIDMKSPSPHQDMTMSQTSSDAIVSRSPSPALVSSKMDKYFSPTYDPRLDVAPLASSSSGFTVDVPATGLVDNAQFEGWDAMLELIRIRREDRAEKKRLERLGIIPDKGSKGGRGKKGEGMVSASAEDGKGIMEIAYQKKGAVREWDMGKEGF